MSEPNGPRIACDADMAAVLRIPAYVSADTRWCTSGAGSGAIYRRNDEGSVDMVGSMNTPELAAGVVAALRAVERLLGPLPPAADEP